MALLTIEIQGLAQLQQRIKDATTGVQRVVAAEIKDGALAIRSDAIRLAPVDEGFLKNNIAVHEIDPLNWSVLSNANYSAFIEFGTKSMVSIPATFEQFAAQFKGASGAQGDFYQAIKDWVKRKGIDEKAAWPIMHKILTEGIRANPFFIPAFMNNQQQIINRIEKALNSVV